ncbi:hypothetical protein EBQ93_01455 [bacterium]|nr:hypothetical protein [bacterium]
MSEKVIVKKTENKVIVSSPGPQGPRGRSILNGHGIPANNFGLAGDFYYDIDTTRFYGPKPSDITWAGAVNYLLQDPATDYAKYMSWELAQIIGPTDGIYSVQLNHNLGFYPNVTIKDSSGDVVETGIEYDGLNIIILTMAQPFSGTAYLS